jgi:hypothetical protein
VSEQIDFDRLEKIAEAANSGVRPWVWETNEKGYPQQIVRQGDAALIAETYDGPQHPPRNAEFIAAFDPPTVLALIAWARAGQDNLKVPEDKP